MIEQKTGRVRPVRKTEPREIGPYAATPDQAEVKPEPVVFNDTGIDLERQIAADSLDATPDSGSGPGGNGGNVLTETGWYDHEGWEVQVIVLGGAPCPYRRRWFQKLLMRG